MRQGGEGRTVHARGGSAWLHPHLFFLLTMLARKLRLKDDV